MHETKHEVLSVETKDKRRSIDENHRIASEFIKLIGCGVIQVMRSDILANEGIYKVDYRKLLRYIETFSGTVLMNGESICEMTERVYGKKAKYLLEKIS